MMHYTALPGGNELLVRRGRAKPARCTALADAETAAVGLNETAGCRQVRQFSGA